MSLAGKILMMEKERVILRNPQKGKIPLNPDQVKILMKKEERETPKRCTRFDDFLASRTQQKYLK